MPNSTSDEPLIDITDQTFDGNVVILDGHQYTDCRFIDCTFQWNGGRFAAINMRVFGTRRIELKSQIAADTVDVLRILGLLTPEFAADWKRD